MLKRTSIRSFPKPRPVQRSHASRVERAYRLARERYAELGVDTERALTRLARLRVSIHCWQGDDVQGFERRQQPPGGGLAVTGNYPGRARTPEELRADLEQALALIPGRHRFNLHASYAETGGRTVERDELGAEHFRNWIAWARAIGVRLDFNPTFFAHPKAADGFTLSHRDPAVRRFWIEHARRCREIGAAMGRAQGEACLVNLWIPDGMKDTPADRLGPRERLVEALDAIFKTRFDRRELLDSVEPKLFGIGSESYVVGSHEFYLGYAMRRGILLTLDTGHYHPTESVADKISAVLLFLPQIALHVSRGVRWDSDHVVTLSDDLQALAQEIVWGGHLERVRIGLDYFDASINRVAAWVIGTRSLLKAVLGALLAPVARLRAAEAAGDYTTRLALMEEARTLPLGAVWDFYCERQGVPPGDAWLAEVRRYEREVQFKRG